MKPSLTMVACLLVLAGAAIGAQNAPSQAGRANVSGEAALGQALFTEHCAICHYDHSTAQKMGPGLKGIYPRGQFADGRKVDDAALARWIENGGKDMPPMKDALTASEIRALVSYLRTL